MIFISFFKEVLPSNEDFVLTACLLPVLMSVNTLSDNFSKENTPVIHFLLISIYKLDSYLAHLKEHDNQTSAGIVRMFFKELLEQLNHQPRFNDHGKQTLAYCMGNFFYPHYRDFLLKE